MEDLENSQNKKSFNNVRYTLTHYLSLIDNSLSSKTLMLKLKLLKTQLIVSKTKFSTCTKGVHAWCPQRLKTFNFTREMPS